MPQPSTAIVILNWNGSGFLRKFLPSVISNAGKCAVVLADNASTDDSVAYVRSNFPEVKIIVNPHNDGFAGGYNRALQEVDAELLILLNSDIETPADWTDPLISFMEKHPEAAACQPKILDYNRKTHFEYAGACGGFIDSYGYPFCRGRIFNHLEEDTGQYNSETEVFWATGACMVVRKNVFEAVGGFDEDYFAHMEEIDLCWRMKNAGHKIFVVPSSHIFHVGGGTLSKINPRKTYLNFRNNLITYTKNHNSPFLFMVIFYRLILDGVAGFKFLLEGSPKHTWAVVKAHWAYFFSLRRTLIKRREQKGCPQFKSLKSGILKGNIVFLHYLKKISTFSSLRF